MSEPSWKVDGEPRWKIWNWPANGSCGVGGPVIRPVDDSLVGMVWVEAATVEVVPLSELQAERERADEAEQRALKVEAEECPNCERLSDLEAECEGLREKLEAEVEWLRARASSKRLLQKSVVADRLTTLLEQGRES